MTRMTSRLFKSLAASVLTTLALGSTSIATAQTDNARNDNIRAAMVFNFARYAEWPADRINGSLRLCVSEDAPIAAALSALSGRNVDARVLEVVPIKKDNNSQCHMAYLSQADAQSSIATDLLSSGVLTVASNGNFSDHGVIELVTIGRQVRFKVNNSAANAAGLHLSSRLLRIAVEVR